MDTQNSGKVIPFFSPRRDEATEQDAMRDLSLARRRGFDTIDPVVSVSPAAATRPKAALGASGAHAKPAETPAGLTAPCLSAVFIESLDDMIRAVPCERTVAAWPRQTNAALDKVAVDIVDMLFGFVLEEPIVPRGIKETLMRAQLPILQLAMRDTRFFADWQHPTRLLLNELPALVRTSIERGGEAGEFEQRFAKALATVLDDLAPNAAAFATLLESMRAYAHDTPRIDDSSDGQAWERAQAVAREFLERPLPQLARDFVADLWLDVLQRTALTYADDSPQWQDAIAVIDELAWSLTPKEAQDERLRLIGQIPVLLSRLNRGLDLIELPREERRPFFDALIEIHAGVLRSELTPTAPPQPVESSRDQVMRLRRGDWVQFAQADGQVSRERLTWISPQRGILVFSNHCAQGAIQISPDELVARVDDGSAMLIFDQIDDAGQHTA